MKGTFKKFWEHNIEGSWRSRGIFIRSSSSKISRLTKPDPPTGLFQTINLIDKITGRIPEWKNLEVIKVPPKASIFANKTAKSCKITNFRTNDRQAEFTNKPTWFLVIFNRSLNSSPHFVVFSVKINTFRQFPWKMPIFSICSAGKIEIPNFRLVKSKIFILGQITAYFCKLHETLGNSCSKILYKSQTKFKFISASNKSMIIFNHSKSTFHQKCRVFLWFWHFPFSLQNHGIVLKVVEN